MRRSAKGAVRQCLPQNSAQLSTLTMSEGWKCQTVASVIFYVKGAIDRARHGRLIWLDWTEGQNGDAWDRTTASQMP